MWSNLRSADDRVSRRTVLSAIGTGLLASSTGCVHPLPPPQGVLLQKGIFGERDNHRVPVLKAGNNDIQIDDDVLRSVLPRSEEPANTTIPVSLHEKLKRRYEDIYYYIKVRKLNAHGPLVKTKSGDRPKQPPLGGTPRYLLSREMFGKLLSGDRFEYTLDLFNDQKVDAITLIIRVGVPKKKFAARNSPGGVPPYRITVDHGQQPDGEPFTQTYFASEKAYNNAKIGSKTYFDVVFENRVRPTIQSFSPDPYGNL